MTAYEFVKANNILLCYNAIEALKAFNGPIEEYFDTHPRGKQAFLWCVKYAYKKILHLLSPERIDSLAKRAPRDALKYVPHLLTPERLDRCAKKAPRIALKYVPHLLTPERLAWCKAQCA